MCYSCLNVCVVCVCVCVFVCTLSSKMSEECLEFLEHAVEVLHFYRDNMNVVLKLQPKMAMEVEADIKAFKMDMKNALEVGTSWGEPKC